MLTHTRVQLDTTCEYTGLPTFACACDYFRERWHIPIPADYADSTARARGLHRDAQGRWQETGEPDDEED